MEKSKKYCKLNYLFFSVLLLFFLLPKIQKADCPPEAETIKTTGEAPIIDGRTGIAKEKALATARWNALRKVSGVQIKAETAVHKMTVMDKMVVEKTKGAVCGVKILKENKKNGLFRVKIRADVTKRDAEKTIKESAIKNTTLTLIATKSNEGFFSGPVVEKIISRLLELDFQVLDEDYLMKNISRSRLDDLSGNIKEIKNVAFSLLSNVTLLMEVNAEITDKPGKVTDSFSLPYYIAKGKYKYRIIETDTGQVIGSGTYNTKGTGRTSEQAKEKALNEIPEGMIGRLTGEMEKYLEKRYRRIEIVVKPAGTPEEMKEIKFRLNNVSFAKEVKSEGIKSGEARFTIMYPEKTYYLAYDLDSFEGFKVEEFSRNRILIVRSEE